MEKFEKKYESIRKTTSMARFLGNINPELGRLYNEFSKLHHPLGYLKEIVEYVLSRSELPLHALGSPMPYNDNELDSIIKLGKEVQRVRLVINDLVEKMVPQVRIIAQIFRLKSHPPHEYLLQALSRGSSSKSPMNPSHG